MSGSLPVYRRNMLMENVDDHKAKPYGANYVWVLHQTHSQNTLHGGGCLSLRDSVPRNGPFEYNC